MAAVAAPNQTMPALPKTPGRVSTGNRSVANVEIKEIKPPQLLYGQTGRSNTGFLVTGPQGQMVVPQKLTFTKLPDIVNRMRQETLSSKSKRRHFYKSDTYVDYKFYTWRNLALWSDFQSHLWKGNGSVKTSFRK